MGQLKWYSKFTQRYFINFNTFKVGYDSSVWIENCYYVIWKQDMSWENRTVGHPNLDRNLDLLVPKSNPAALPRWLASGMTCLKRLCLCSGHRADFVTMSIFVWHARCTQSTNPNKLSQSEQSSSQEGGIKKIDSFDESFENHWKCGDVQMKMKQFVDLWCM